MNGDGVESHDAFLTSLVDPVIIIRNFFFQHKIDLESPKVGFLLLYSGGVDSAVLLHTLLKVYPFPEKVQALHIDYGLREMENQKEVEGIRKICDEKKIVLHQVSFPLFYMKTESGNLQSQARKIRYYEAIKIVQKYRLNFILTGHHRDDHLETFFAKLLKGQSPASLARIMKEAGLEKIILRPLSGIAKANLETYSKKNSIVYFSDSSNDEINYERNYLRNQIFPLLDVKFSNWRSNLFQTLKFFSQGESLLDKAQTWIQELPTFLSLKHIRGKKYNFRVPGFILHSNFADLSREEKEYLFHRALYYKFPEKRFSRNEIKAILNKNGKGDSELFTYTPTSDPSKKYQVVYSRGWVAPLIQFVTEGESSFIIQLQIQEDEKKSLLHQVDLGVAKPGKVILSPQTHFDISVPIFLPKKLTSLKKKKWIIRPLSEYDKSQRVGKKTIKKHLESKKLPLPVRSALLGLSLNEKLVGAINLWGYRDNSDSPEGYFMPF